MGVCLFANDAVASLAAAVATTDTTIALATGAGALFPNPTGGDYFIAVLYSASQEEIVKVTARATDTLTVLRAQENTAALSFAPGDKIELRLTAATMQAMVQSSGQGNAANRDIGFSPGQVADGEFSVRTGMGMPFFGPAASVPSDYLLCNGAAVSRTTYARLFAVIGTTFGAGDGSTTFNLPNMQDRVGVGAGGTYARGATGGAATAQVTVQGHALTVNETAPHSHSWSATPHSHGVNDSGHSHGVYDPGHSHGVADPGHDHGYVAMQAPWNGANNDVSAGTAGSQNGARTTHEGTGISIYGANTGVGVYAANANISLQASTINGANGSTGGGAEHTHPVSLGTNYPPFLAMNWIIKT